MRAKSYSVLACLFASSLITKVGNISESTPALHGTDAPGLIKLEKVLTIRGIGLDDPFREPYDIHIGKDGSIYFYDSSEFYKFSPQGRFVFKIIRPGQGPGEAEMRTVAAIMEDKIIVQATSPPKVMWFDTAGHLTYERRLDIYDTYLFIFSAGSSLYGLCEGLPSHTPDVKEGYIDLPTRLYEITPDFRKRVEGISFPVQNYVFGGGQAWFQSLIIKYALKGDDTLFISHTPDYKLLKYDFKRNIIERTFGRKYKRVARPPEKQTRKGLGVVLSAPPTKFYVDISKLLVYRDQLWVVTSTRDSNQNRMVDVYDMEGNFVNSFYLQYPVGTSHTFTPFGDVVFHGEWLFSIDEEDDGSMCVNQYRVIME